MFKLLDDFFFSITGLKKRKIDRGIWYQLIILTCLFYKLIPIKFHVLNYHF